MITCEPSSSVIVAPARSAIERVRSAPAALSPFETTAHDGRFFQAGGPFGSPNAPSPVGPCGRALPAALSAGGAGAQARGRCVAALTAACSAGRSAAKAAWNFAGSIANSPPGPPPFGDGYWWGTS